MKLNSTLNRQRRKLKALIAVWTVTGLTFLGSNLFAHRGTHIDVSKERHAFVRLNKRMTLTHCLELPPESKVKGPCFKQKVEADGSGVIIKNTEKGSFVLSAAHVCDQRRQTLETRLPFFLKQKQFKVTQSSILIKSLNGHEFNKVKVIKMDEKNDLCLLFVEGLKEITIPISKFSPRIGSYVVNIAAPGRTFTTNVVPIFKGWFIGNVHINQLFGDKGKIVVSAYSDIFVLGGSSGSMILNIHGELIGIMTMTLNKGGAGLLMGMGPTYHQMVTFLKANKIVD